MGKPTGFMEYERNDRSYAPAADRVQHYREFVIPLADNEIGQQGARCTDCGACEAACVVNAIYPDKSVPRASMEFVHISASWFREDSYIQTPRLVCDVNCDHWCSSLAVTTPITCYVQMFRMTGSEIGHYYL